MIPAGCWANFLLFLTLRSESLIRSLKDEVVAPTLLIFLNKNVDETLYAQMWQMKQGSMHPSLSLRIYQHLFEQTKVVLPKVTQYPFFSKISDVVTPQGQK